MISAAGAITTANENMLLSSENNQKSVGRSATNDMTSKCETGSKPEGSGLILDNKKLYLQSRFKFSDQDPLSVRHSLFFAKATTNTTEQVRWFVCQLQCSA